MRKKSEARHFCKITKRMVNIISEWELASGLGNKTKKWVGPHNVRCIYDQECWNKQISCLHSGYGREKPNPFK